MRYKVQVWLYKKDPKDQFHYLILQTDAQRKSFWQPITGSVEEGESVAAAAVREATEETGLRFTGIPETIGPPFRFRSYEQEFEEQAFAMEAIAGPIRLDPNEHMDFKWATASEAERLVKFDSNRERLKLLVEKLSSVR